MFVIRTGSPESGDPGGGGGDEDGGLGGARSDQGQAGLSEPLHKLHF